MQLPITRETMPPPDLKKSKLLQEKKDLDILYPSENVIIKDKGTKSEFSMSGKRFRTWHAAVFLASAIYHQM